MGVFVLGVLVGWLAEWLFYTFWVKRNEDGDCSSLKAELELKNRQISSLQSQLSSVSESSSNKTGSEAKQDSSSVKSAASSTAKKSSKTSKPKVVSSKKATANKAVKSSSASSKTTKSATTKTAPKKSASKTTNKTKSNTKSTKSNTKKGGDDFTKLSGIGPSMAATLKTLGIDTFQKLANTDDDILRDMLEDSGARMNNNKEAMDSWNEQATLAAKGDFTALKKMQAEMKK